MIFLSVIIVILLVFIGFQEYFNRKERQKLIETIIAKNLGEIRDLEATRKVYPKTEPKEEEFVPMSELDDKTFDKYVKNINGLEKEEENG